MKRQWSLILAFLFALVVAMFAVINGEPVEVDYLFGKANWPLVLVILGSVVMGAIIIAAGGMFKFLSLKRELRIVKKENMQLKESIENDRNNSEQIRPENTTEMNHDVIEVQNEMDK